MSVIELRNTKYALSLSLALAPPTPSRGRLFARNLLAPAGLYPSVGLRFCSSWQGNWKWSARAAGIAGSPGDPLCLGCDDLLHNKVNVLFHLELTVSFAKKRTASVRGNRAGARMSTPTYESSRQTAKMNKERLAANHPAIWMKKQKGRPQSAKTWLASGD